MNRRTQALQGLFFAAGMALASPSFAQLAPGTKAPPIIVPATSPAAPTKARDKKAKAGKKEAGKVAAPTTIKGADDVPKGTIVEKIVVKGNRKIEADAIRAKLGTKEGGAYSEDTIRQDITDLYALNRGR